MPQLFSFFKQYRGAPPANFHWRKADGSGTLQVDDRNTAEGGTNRDPSLLQPQMKSDDFCKSDNFRLQPVQIPLKMHTSSWYDDDERSSVAFSGLKTSWTRKKVDFFKTPPASKLEVGMDARWRKKERKRWVRWSTNTVWCTDHVQYH